MHNTLIKLVKCGCKQVFIVNIFVVIVVQANIRKYWFLSKVSIDSFQDFSTKKDIKVVLLGGRKIMLL